MIKPLLGILLGDATGVGPELIAKLCSTAITIYIAGRY